MFKVQGFISKTINCYNVGILTSKQWIGEDDILLNKGKYLHTVISKESCTILEISKSDLLKLPREIQIKLIEIAKAKLKWMNQRFFKIKRVYSNIYKLNYPNDKNVEEDLKKMEENIINLQEVYPGANCNILTNIHKNKEYAARKLKNASMSSMTSMTSMTSMQTMPSMQTMQSTPTQPNMLDTSIQILQPNTSQISSPYIFPNSPQNGKNRHRVTSFSLLNSPSRPSSSVLTLPPTILTSNNIGNLRISSANHSSSSNIKAESNNSKKLLTSTDIFNEYPLRKANRANDHKLVIKEVDYSSVRDSLSINTRVRNSLSSPNLKNLPKKNRLKLSTLCDISPTNTPKHINDCSLFDLMLSNHLKQYLDDLKEPYNTKEKFSLTIGTFNKKVNKKNNKMNVLPTFRNSISSKIYSVLAS